MIILNKTIMQTNAITQQVSVIQELTRYISITELSTASVFGGKTSPLVRMNQQTYLICLPEGCKVYVIFYLCKPLILLKLVLSCLFHINLCSTVI